MPTQNSRRITADKGSPANAGDAGLISSPGGSHMPGAGKPERHNSWACALEPGGCGCRPVRPRPALSNREATAGRSRQHALGSPALCSSRPSTAKKSERNWLLESTMEGRLVAPGKEPACQRRGRASRPDAGRPHTAVGQRKRANR